MDNFNVPIFLNLLLLFSVVPSTIIGGVIWLSYLFSRRKVLREEQSASNPKMQRRIDQPQRVLLQLGAGAKKAPFLLCDQRYVPVLSGRLEYPANNHCIRIRVTIGKHRALPLPQ